MIKSIKKAESSGLTSLFNSKTLFKTTATALGALMLSFGGAASMAEAKRPSATIALPVSTVDSNLRFHEGTYVPGKSEIVMPERIILPPVTSAIIRPAIKKTGRGLSLSDAIEKASLLTGVDKNYLHHLAQAESSGNPKAVSSSKTSSAKGAYGFTNNTWLMTLKKFGPSLGYANAADRIVVAGGKYYVPNKKDRKHIMKTMRHDPLCSSLMVAAHTKENYEALNAGLSMSHQINGTDLYMAHFLGPNGAIKFLNTNWLNPFNTVADLFPQAAREKGNRPLIYPNGRPQRLGQFYNVMTKKVPPTPVRMTRPQTRRNTL